ncbi:MAG: fused acetyl/propionyl-CoA carboxylase subunit alpha/methylmalonyl-CoA decarboxylase subunit alpha, partial [Thermoleophilia bacterium]|nr:fused acetyl/propionyl-CoA carboxylase subunit alpha/methylmalonyl-CoA decarboxylase subunit alpha [Thermoleophilia bacterium]
TNRSFLLDLLEHPAVIDGTADTAWLNRRAPEELISAVHADVALIAAAIEADAFDERIERRAFQASARRGRPKADPTIVRTIELQHRGSTYAIRVSRVGLEHYRVSVDGNSVDAIVERLGRFESRMRVNDVTYRVVSVFNAPDHLVEVNGVSHRVSRDEGGLVRSPAPALVVGVSVAPGDEVTAGDTVVVLESMKMETAVAAPFDGTVAAVLAAENTQVDAGAPLLRLAPMTDEPTAAAGDTRVAFGGLVAPPPSEARARIGAQMATIRSLFLGFDIDEDEAREVLRDLESMRSALPADDLELRQGELELLSVFADMAELSRNRPPIVQDPEIETVHSPREDFHRYLRSLDPDREGIAEPLRRSLRRALDHYGVHDFEPTLEHAEAAYRIFHAQERASTQLPAVLALLDQLSRAGSNEEDPLHTELKETLDRLVVATELRHPAVGELARRVRFSIFDRPVLAEAQERVYAGARRRLERLAEDPERENYDQLMEAVVDSPQPLLPLLAERLSGGAVDHEPMLEVLTRRYYKIRNLQDVTRLRHGDRQFVTASYEHQDQGARLVTTLADAADLPTTALELAELATADNAARAIGEIYLLWKEPPDPDVMAEEISKALAPSPELARLSRLAISVVGAGGDVVSHFTYRRIKGVLREDRVVRGLHPMIARRLHFGRLAHFEVARMPSVEDTYLFHCSDRSEEADERLIALAEVRDLTTTREVFGALTSLPEVEHVLANCLDSIRRARAESPPMRRLQANQVFLYVWPVVDLPIREMVSVARSLAPMTAGLGLEQVLLHFTASEAGSQSERAIAFSYQPGTGATASLLDSPIEPLAAVSSYSQRVMSARRRGAAYPYELIPLVAGPEGTFIEHDLDEKGRLVEVDRGPGQNGAGIIAGLVSTPTKTYPEGITRVVLFGDPTRALGAVAEPECARILAAIDLADQLSVPLEWYALSSGAKISRDSGTENMDWVAAVLRRLITFTQDG